MKKKGKFIQNNSANGANPGFENKLWEMAGEPSLPTVKQFWKDDLTYDPERRLDRRDAADLPDRKIGNYKNLPPGARFC